MHISSLLVAGLAAVAHADGVSNPHHKAQQFARKVPVKRAAEPENIEKRSASKYLNHKTKKFAVNGSAIPDVDFDAGESYAGTLSINSNSSNENQLFFWFWPSENVNATDEITIWLNGGPGCSSMDGLLQENGPFLWQPGTYKPQRNYFSWTNLTNMVWVDQPIGTGLSSAAKGAPQEIKNEIDVAKDFAGFWKNFMKTFDLKGRKVYIAGESYAGQYIPYIAQYMLEQNNTEYYNVKGIQINDPSIGDDTVLEEAPAVTHMIEYNNVFNLNQSYVDSLVERADKCGYFEFMDKALTFPPEGKLIAPNSSISGCDVFDDILVAAVYANPCFNIYHITDYCPYLWNELGFPSLAIGPNNYFNRSDVQKAIHAEADFSECGDNTLGLRNPGDTSQPSSYSAIPYVLEKTNNVVIGHGLLDFVLLANGTLATIQNMTWNGAQGFSERPSGEFFVPYNEELGFVEYESLYQPDPSVPVGLVGGGGIVGTTHTERGLTFSTIALSGHMIPQYVPGAAYRQLEFLLGRIDSLTAQPVSFTTQTGNFSGSTPPDRARK